MMTDTAHTTLLVECPKCGRLEEVIVTVKPYLRMGWLTVEVRAGGKRHDCGKTT